MIYSGATLVLGLVFPQLEYCYLQVLVGATVRAATALFSSIAIAVVIAVTVYVALDIEYPRLGFIRVDEFDQALVDLRNNMN